MDTYDIKIIVKFDGLEYIAERKYLDQGCNHIDNLPGVADYMANEILRKINNRKRNT